MTLTLDDLRSIGLSKGLAAVGCTHAEPFAEAEQTLVERKAAGLHGGMQFTYRNPPRSTTPSRALSGVASLIVGAWPYAHAAAPSEMPPSPLDGVPLGTIAAYAWRDHYADLRGALQAIADALIEEGFEARVLADDNALVDRAAAVRAGLGWFGKNSNVLVPGAGSWFVLGSVLTNAELEPDAEVPAACGPCRRCLDSCPTGAIVASGVVDARRCLAWLLQQEGDFPQEFRVALGSRIYGCDDCQEVCPPSRDHEVALVGDEVASVDLVDLLGADDEAITDAHGRWYVPRREMNYVRRNALIALGNVLAESPALIASARPTLEAHLRHVDPMLRRHAAWAAGRSDDEALMAVVRATADEELVAELAAVERAP